MRLSLEGKLFSVAKWGRLSPVKFVRDDQTKSGKVRPVFLFRCDCGAEKEIRGYSVTSGKTKSCGCLKTDKMMELHVTHGAARTSGFDLAYKSWRNMLTRARNPNIAQAARYSLRGIGVCSAWDPAKSEGAYEAFLSYIGPRPSRFHHIDRIDHNRGYEPGNVRWVHRSESRELTNRARIVVFNGARMTVAEAARQSGVKEQVIRDRLKAGWPLDKLFGPRARSAFGMGPSSRPGVMPRI